MYSNFPKITTGNLTRMAIEENCIELDKKFYKINMSEESFNNLERHIHIYIDEDINNISDGVYTWIVGTNYNENIPHIYLTKVYTINEIGTKHQNIVNRLRSLEYIHFAGEMYVSNKIYYNFFSGTFMLDVVNALNPDKEILHIFKKFMKTITSTEINYVKKEIINRENLLFTYEDLNLLYSFGADIHIYNTKEDCNKSLSFQVDIAKYYSMLNQEQRKIDTMQRLKMPYNPRTFEKPIDIAGIKYNSKKSSARLLDKKRSLNLKKNLQSF